MTSGPKTSSKSKGKSSSKSSASKGAGAATRRSRSSARLLRQLGLVVRARRSELGLTLRALAAQASVSERFLVQVEAGEGNISVARLEELAEALSLSAAELLTRASRAREASSARCVVALVGLRGAGKSSIGAAVAHRTKVPFVELDELIVREAQMTLSSIFEIHGETYYRSLEREVLRRLLEQREPMVVATGGSIVTDAETWGLLRSRARTVWLKATPDEHWNRVVAQGDVRPMRDRPRAKNELRALLAEREPLYEQSETIVETSGKTPADVVDRIVDEISR